MTIPNSNIPSFIADGRKAGAALTSGAKQMDKGEALAVAVLYQALHTGYEMSFATKRAGDETDAPVTFTLKNYGDNIVSENGKNDGKAISARKSAMYSDLFGLIDFSPAQDAVVSRALMSAHYLHNLKAEPSINSKGLLVVPNEAIRPAPPADASDNDKAIYDAMKGKGVSLDGKKGTSLRELRNRAVAAQPRKTRKVKATAVGDNEKDFRTSLAFLLSIIETVNKSDESPIAFNADDIAKLKLLSVGINAIEGEEVKEERKAA